MSWASVGHQPVDAPRGTSQDPPAPQELQTVPVGGMFGDGSRRVSLGWVPPGLCTEVTAVPWPCSQPQLCHHVCEGRGAGVERLWPCRRPAGEDLRH